MNLPHVIVLWLKVGHLILFLRHWLLSLISLNLFSNGGIMTTAKGSSLFGGGEQMWLKFLDCVFSIHRRYVGFRRVRRSWARKLLVAWIVFWCVVSGSVFLFMSSQAMEKRKETLTSMCDERARMLQDQFNVSMNQLQAMSVMISIFHHSKNPSAIDQMTFAKYTEETTFERPLTSGVAYAVRVLCSERERFESEQGWTIKRMDNFPVHEDDPKDLEPSPVQEEYAPVIFAQETVSHVISVDVLSGKEDRENVLRARESGKGVLTAPFRLLKTNRLGVILTFAIYRRDLPPDPTPAERIQATAGYHFLLVYGIFFFMVSYMPPRRGRSYSYLGGIFDVESLVEKLLQQLASEQTIHVNVYDTTDPSRPISMYGSNAHSHGLYHASSLNFGDPFRKHEMHCRFKQKPPWPWLAIGTSIGILIILLLAGQILYATINRIAKVEDDYHKMMELKKRAEAADIAKSQ
ncbi:histidine kinase cytokinin receptor, partial [Genlisea aurea]